MAIHSEIDKTKLLKVYTDYTKSDEWRVENHDKIAIAAYYKAQARDFKPGGEMQDWLEAENEIAYLFVPPPGFFV